MQNAAKTADKVEDPPSNVPAWKKKTATVKEDDSKTKQVSPKKTPAWKKSAPTRAASPTVEKEEKLSAQNSFFGSSEEKIPAWKKKLNEKKAAVTPKEAKPANPATKVPPPAAAPVEEVDPNMPAWKRKLMEQKAKKEAELAALMG